MLSAEHTVRGLGDGAPVGGRRRPSLAQCSPAVPTCPHRPASPGAEFPASPSPLLPTSALALWLLSMPPARPYHLESLFTNQRHLLGPIPLRSGIQKTIRFSEPLPNSVCRAATPRQPHTHARVTHLNQGAGGR